MKIAGSTISMSGRTSLVEQHTKEENLRMWTGDERPDSEGRSGLVQQPPVLKIDILELSQESKNLQAGEALSSGCVEDDESVTFRLSEKDKQKLLAIQKMIEVLTGKKIRFRIMDEFKLKKLNRNAASSVGQQDARLQQEHGWGLEYDYHESHYEKQMLSFISSGIIRTADGREINFSVELNMSREFASRHDVSLRLGDAVMKDPLVINFDGAAPSLTDARFSFDLDCDGQEDWISFVSPGSGFLALDINNDGRINDGGELFGPESGDGFGDLAEYDADQNNWIDENDPIYEKLRIWTRDENGNEQLFALGQKGVGAIYLGSVDTSFDLKNGGNQLQGSIRKTGIFVRENGTAGTIQHIDIAI